MHKFSEQKAKQIETLAGLGLRDSDIALVVEVAEATMKRRYTEHLKKGRAVARGAVAKTAYQMAVGGKVPAMTMFWLKTQCGFRERDLEESNQQTIINFYPSSKKPKED
jgi:uncharacterized membrane protein YebE (DUF533 family)